MRLLPFGRRSAKANADVESAEPDHTMSNTRQGIVLIDDTDLGQFGNNYELYDTGPRGGVSAFVLDIHATPASVPAPPPSVRASRKPVPLGPPPMKKSDSNAEPVVMLGASGERFFDTPIVFEDDATLASSDIFGQRRHGYKGSVSSVDVLRVPNGAIRTGGPVKLFGTQYIGLLFNWFLLGLMDGGTQTLITPLFAHYLHMPQFQLQTVTTLLQSVWLFKIVLAYVSDTISIRRQRRKPYIYIGWAIVSVCMLALVCLPGVKPYQSSSDGDVQNEQAPSEGARYVPFLVVASFGQLWTAVACEGLVVELAQRETQCRRGQTQCIIVICQLVGQCIGTTVVSLGLNSAAFGGHFPGAIPVQAVFGLFGLMAMLGIVLTWFVIVDEVNAMTTTAPMTSQLRRLGHLVQHRSFCQLLTFGFLCASALACDVLESQDVYTTWLHARPLDRNLSLAATFAGAACATFLVYRLWLNANWRALLLTSLALTVVVAVPIDILTYSDVCRSLGVFITKDVLVSVFNAVIRLLQLLVIVEFAEPGLEATTYALVTTAYHLAGPLVAIISNAVASAVSGGKHNLTVDSPAVRLDLTVELAIMMAVRIGLILVASLLLPRQKSHARELHFNGSYGGVLPLLILVAFLAAYLMVGSSRVLALIESTSCLVFAGGRGCAG